MNRIEFMKALEALLTDIDVNERENVLQYYNDYFDDAGIENEPLVIEELGSPKRIVDSITAGINSDNIKYTEDGIYTENGFTNPRYEEKPFEVSKKSQEESEAEKEKRAKEEARRAKYRFEKSWDCKIIGLHIDVGVTSVIIKTGEKLEVVQAETRRPAICYVEDDILYLKDKVDWSFLGINIPDKRSITITVPGETTLENLVIKIGAGYVNASSLTAKKARFEVGVGKMDLDNITVLEETKIKVDAGQLVANELMAHDTDLQCQIGQAIIEGSLTGKGKIECNLGNVKLNQELPVIEFAYDIKCNMGSVSIDNNIYTMVNHAHGSKEEVANYMKLDCNLGSIHVRHKEQ